MIRNYPCATEAGVAAHIRYYDAPCAICKAWLAKVDAGLAAKPAPIKAPKKHDAGLAAKPAPIKAPKPPKVQREPKARAECGSTEAFHQHVSRGEEIDPACREAINAYNRERYAKRQQSRPAARARRTDPIEHGTPKGRGQHVRRGEEVCDPCREAYNKDQAEKRAARIATRKKAKEAQA